MSSQNPNVLHAVCPRDIFPRRSFGAQRTTRIFVPTSIMCGAYAPRMRDPHVECWHIPAQEFWRATYDNNFSSLRRSCAVRTRHVCVTYVLNVGNVSWMKTNFILGENIQEFINSCWKFSNIPSIQVYATRRWRVRGTYTARRCFQTCRKSYDTRGVKCFRIVSDFCRTTGLRGLWSQQHAHVWRGRCREICHFLRVDLS